MRRLAISRRQFLQVGLASVAAAATPALAQRPDDKAKPLDQSFVIGTDTASIYLYHPADLAHRLKSPDGWERYGFACGKEFAAGRLVLFTTGGDGGYGVRVTTGKLTDRERKMFIASWDFRFRVRHGKVCLDGGYHVPNEDFEEPKPEYDFREWFELPNGDYRVEVSDIDAFKEPGMVNADGTLKPEGLPAYVVRFERVEKLDAVPVRAPTGPRMSGKAKPTADQDQAESETFVETKDELGTEAYTLVESPKWQIVPGFDESVAVSDEVAKTRDKLPFLLTGPGAAAGRFGVLAPWGSMGRTGDEPWQMQFRALRLVRIKELLTEEGKRKARIEPITRDLAEVPAAELTALKKQFAEYAAKNETYRKEVECPDFEAERAEALTTTEGLTNCLIHHVRITDERRLALLQLGTAERVRELSKILSAAKP